ncbi:hypothetical protein GCM10010156_13200 [Planobispora rosea]|uniref:Uncharacterized protein n=1 Tax=Planobispora rosea TaxID=35762 RepID=A0A8J3S4W4_PLARO|nr:hypothetical protein GCM10010156_13200 [Planobispora rosea]GIH83608.1 hypothetical protein Pro02_20160 [Planobispora rosea]
MKVESLAASVPPPVPGLSSSPPQAAADRSRTRPAVTAAVLRRGIPYRRMLHLIAVLRPGPGRRADPP